MAVTPSAERFQDLVSGRARGVGATATRCGLRVASWPYGLVVRVRNWLYDHGRLTIHQAGAPVVSVGNLTLGGTGKTPCVEYLARYFRDRDVRVAILSRGYGGSGGPNDEALVLEENLPDVPHLQGPDRAALANTAIEELESELLILDDGFQHRRLARDLDVVLVDAMNPWGHGRLFPAGLLREPAAGLKRADAVLLTRCDQVSANETAQLRAEVKKLVRAGTPMVETRHRPMEWLQHGSESRTLESLTGRPAIGFCGLGNPEAFRRTLADVGIELREFRTFADHHRYTRHDVDGLRQWADQHADCIAVTTQKDLVKLRIDRIGQCDLFALRIGLHLSPGNDVVEFEKKLSAVSGQCR